MNTKYRVGIIFVAIGIMALMLIPDLVTLFSATESYFSPATAIAVIFGLVVVLGTYLVGAGNRDYFKGRSYENLKPGKRYIVRSITKLGDYSYLYLEPYAGRNDIISFRTELNTDSLSKNDMMIQTEDGRISKTKEL